MNENDRQGGSGWTDLLTQFWLVSAVETQRIELFLASPTSSFGGTDLYVQVAVTVVNQLYAFHYQAVIDQEKFLLSFSCFFALWEIRRSQRTSVTVILQREILVPKPRSLPVPAPAPASQTSLNDVNKPVVDISPEFSDAHKLLPLSACKLPRAMQSIGFPPNIKAFLHSF
jgi:hypothetical protein